jgi:enamine deaminase RidA (YjgF/YER057c/UK114 family)
MHGPAENSSVHVEQVTGTTTQEVPKSLIDQLRELCRETGLDFDKHISNTVLVSDEDF